MSKDKAEEIRMTQIFNANDIVAESDLWLQYQIREVMRRSNVSNQRKAAILSAERDELFAAELAPTVQAGTAEL